MNATETSKRAVSAIQATAAVAEAIREVGEIPSGHLYAQLVGVVTFEMYASIIALLKRADLVSEVGHVLRWVGPKLEQS